MLLILLNLGNFSLPNTFLICIKLNVYSQSSGSAVGFRLDSLPKLAETRARNNKLTLIHYLCKVLSSFSGTRMLILTQLL